MSNHPTYLDEHALWLRLHQMRIQGIPVVQGTVIRRKNSAAAKVGDKILITDTGEVLGWVGGGCTQPAVLKAAKQVLVDGQARIVAVGPKDKAPSDSETLTVTSSCPSGGTLEIFLEAFLPGKRLLLMGSSPMLQCLSSLAHKLGWSVTVADPLVQATDFPDAIECFQDYHTETLENAHSGVIIIGTQGRGDKKALHAALETHAQTIGFISSQKKAQTLRERLSADGVSAQSLARVRAPFGLAINAQNPAEIALSALAAIVQIHNSGDNNG